MGIENHVTSVEASKKLKELGIKQKGFYKWNFYIEASPKLARISQYFTRDLYGCECIAFLVSELLMMLPPKIHEDDYTFLLTLIKETEGKFESSYRCHFKSREHAQFASYGNLADSLANLILCAVLDLKCITVNEINARIENKLVTDNPVF